MTTHELKCWPVHFKGLEDGTKTLELRLNDRGFAAGDRLRLREWDPATGRYTGRFMRREVTHVLRDPEGRWLQPGVVALSIVRKEGDNDGE